MNRLYNEQKQSSVRITTTAVVLALVIAATMLGLIPEHSIIAVSAYLTFSLLHSFALTKVGELTAVFRRWMLLICDLAAISYLLAFTGNIGLAFYPVLLWIIIDTGTKFGIKYSYGGTVIGSMFLLIALNISGAGGTEELSRNGLAFGLLFGLVSIPVFYTNLLARYEENSEAYKKHITSAMHMATHDALTKLPNRILFRDRLEQAQEGYQRTKTPFAAMLIDLDDFKPINDKYGHDAGDKLLTAVAVRMKRILRANDTIARIGGDEFAAILTDTGGVGGAAIVAEKLVNELKAPVKIGDVTVTVGASIGVGMFGSFGNQFSVKIKLCF